VLEAMSKMAGILGKSTEAARYAKLHTAAATDFHTIFYNTTTGTYGNDYGAIQCMFNDNDDNDVIYILNKYSNAQANVCHPFFAACELF
jgi:hypothetical protein